MQTSHVFEAVHRGYNDLEESGHQEIIAYFNSIEPDAMIGHISNIKGILFEQEVVRRLADQGITTQLFEATNHPVVDIALWSDSEIALEAQLKATDSLSYINSTLATHPDVPIIATSEVAGTINEPLVIDSGLSNEHLTDMVEATLNGSEVIFMVDAGGEVSAELAGEELAEAISDIVLPVSPLSVLGWFFGLPF